MPTLQKYIEYSKLKFTMSKKKQPPHYYLFLDFDGVINASYPPGSKEASDENAYETANHYCMERINHLCLDYELKVVLSTSWRYSGRQYCMSYLKNSGFDRRIQVVGMTPEAKDYDREWEIMSWLNAHPGFSGFLILDDIPMSLLGKYEVRTNFDGGYTEEADCRARKIMDAFVSNNPKVNNK